MIKKLRNHIDWIVLLLGISALLATISPLRNFSTLTEIWCIAVGLIGLAYLGFVLYERYIHRIEYDIKLVNESHIIRVIAIVLIVPFTLGAIILLPNMNLYISPELHLPEEHIAENNSLFWRILFHFMGAGDVQESVEGSYHFWVPLLCLLGIFLLDGLLVSAIINAVESRREKWLHGDIRYKKLHFASLLGKAKDFAIVIGANELAPTVIHDLLAPSEPGKLKRTSEKENHYVVLQTSKEPQVVRETLASELSEEELQRVIIYRARRDSKLELEKLLLDRCSEIYILGENTTEHEAESGHDSLNMRSLNLIANLLKQQKVAHRKVCKVLFENQSTYSIFIFSDISAEVKEHIAFIPFNRYESWARYVMCGTGNEHQYTPLDGQGITLNEADRNKYVHLVVIGMSKMGEAMGIRALLQSHHLNGKRARISFIDADIEPKMNRFKSNYTHLFELIRHRKVDARQIGTNVEWIDPFEETKQWSHLSHDGRNFLDAEIEFIQGTADSDGVRSYLKHLADDAESLLTIAICLEHDEENIATSIYLPTCMYAKAQEIWVLQSVNSDLIQNIALGDKRYSKLRAFGMQNGQYIAERMQYFKALLVNSAYDLGLAESPEQAMLRMKDIDFTDKESYKQMRVSWRELPLDLQFSNRYFVESIDVKLRAIGAANTNYERTSALLKENEAILARCEHSRWVMQKLLLGYAPASQEIDKEMQQLDKEQFAQRKRELKGSRQRIHIDICDYEHLHALEPVALPYDIALNNSIVNILAKVDSVKMQ